ncbi:MAG: DUF2971 domain-containing protein [Ignavibacteriae bacterium]|nr:DUF2971 domain-containing protein [Ignavibacteriota bacterium]MCB9215681.1 DUF2971 domain-containing protein [Ignavibacteria bacterium]
MSDEDFLWHYTTASGLLGILPSDPDEKEISLWASNARYLNDESEFSYYLKRLSEVAKNKFENTNSVSSNEFEEVSSALQKMAVEDPPFVVSLSKKEDDLNQWRAYGSGLNGFCIGFSRKDLRKVLKDSQFRLSKCIYKEDDLQKHVERQVKNLHMVIPTANHPLAFIKWVFKQLSLAAVMKNPVFDEEDEWRMVSDAPLLRGSSPNSAIHPRKYREGKSMLIPYVEVKMDRKVVKKIIVGPGPHKELNYQSVKRLCKDFMNGTDIKISMSSVPFRMW